MHVWAFPSLLSMAACILLSAFMVWQRKTFSLFLPLLAVITVMAWIQGMNAMSLISEEHVLVWKKLVLLGDLMLPVSIGYVIQALLQNFTSNPQELGSGWWKIMAGGVAVFGLGILAIPDGFLQVNDKGVIVITSPEGLTIWSYILVAMFMVLSRLEQMFRSFQDPLRYRLKYVLMGLGGLACMSIAQAMYMLLIPVWRPDVVWAEGIAALSSLFILGFGMGRWHLPHIYQKVQISHHALYTSLTVLCVGGYLILAGVVAGVIQHTGWEVKEALGIVVVFLAGLSLVVVMHARQARAAFRQFLVRHFFRTKYDYREKWLEVTETLTACKNPQQVWNRYLEWLSRTFGTSRVTIWKFFDVDGRFHRIRTERRRRSWSENEDVSDQRDPLPLPSTHPLILQMKSRQEPVVIQGTPDPLQDWEDFLFLTQAHVCVPLLAGEGKLLGFCTLSQHASGKEYDQEDVDLLRVIAHHVSMLLVQFQLVEERNSAAKWEAVHKFSAFYLHDLKNLAGSLSLLVQNAEQYGHDPEFQISAIQTVKTTSQRIIDLMRELAHQAKEPDLRQESITQAADLNLIIHETLAAIRNAECQPQFYPGREVPPFPMKVESVKQVFLNLILNACQATEEKGSIDITTAYDGEQVIVEVVDTGNGMPMSRLENLFQPFASSKEHGLGVGLYQCKRIVEDHQGLIHIESEEGRGTTVIVTFPVQITDNSTTTSTVSKTGSGDYPKRNR